MRVGQNCYEPLVKFSLGKGNSGFNEPNNAKWNGGLFSSWNRARMPASLRGDILKAMSSLVVQPNKVAGYNNFMHGWSMAGLTLDGALYECIIHAYLAIFSLVRDKSVLSLIKCRMRGFLNTWTMSSAVQTRHEERWTAISNLHMPWALLFSCLPTTPVGYSL